MKRFEVTSKALRIHSGVLALSGEQASSRRHALKEIDAGLFQVVSSVEFKLGEVFGHDGDLPKSMASQVKTPGEKPAKPKGKKKKKGDQSSVEVTPEAFAEAVAKLDEETPGNFTQDGRPDIKALKDLGIVVNASQRDDLWKATQQTEKSEEDPA